MAFHLVWERQNDILQWSAAKEETGLIHQTYFQDGTESLLCSVSPMHQCRRHILVSACVNNSHHHAFHTSRVHHVQPPVTFLSHNPVQKAALQQQKWTGEIVLKTGRDAKLFVSEDFTVYWQKIVTIYFVTEFSWSQCCHCGPAVLYALRLKWRRLPVLCRLPYI